MEPVVVTCDGCGVRLHVSRTRLSWLAPLVALAAIAFAISPRSATLGADGAKPSPTPRRAGSSASVPSVPPSPAIRVAERPVAQSATRPGNLSAPRTAIPTTAVISTRPPAPAPAELARRIRIRDEKGEVVVARVHGIAGDKISVLMPDGQLGFATGLTETDEPFRPATAAQMREALTREGPFADFHVRQSAHYLVLYQSTPTFSDASIRLLEDLYRNLTESLKKRDFPVHEPEFPLVAIIFRSERDFRAFKDVDPDVQAYYEILTNRIYFYQKSERDQQSPETAALRKPQTVAHEGTHQILQNIGIQPRLSAWPLWLVEGLAEYCATPTKTRRGAATWGGLGLVNPMHMATIHDVSDPLSSQVKGEGRPRLGRDPRTPLVEYLVTRSRLTPTDYAFSWALTHYLATKRGTDFLAYLKTMGRVPPLKEIGPEEHLAAFRAAFGTDLAKLDRTVATYLSRLKYDPLPFYAVMFQQPLGAGMVRRATLVSQSPSVIRQWLDEVSSPRGGPSTWEVFPYPSRARAQLSADQWLGRH